jgi:hypothetical protein
VPLAGERELVLARFVLQAMRRHRAELPAELD